MMIMKYSIQDGIRMLKYGFLGVAMILSPTTAKADDVDYSNGCEIHRGDINNDRRDDVYIKKDGKYYPIAGGNRVSSYHGVDRIVLSISWKDEKNKRGKLCKKVQVMGYRTSKYRGVPHTQEYDALMLLDPDQSYDTLDEIRKVIDHYPRNFRWIR